MGQPGGGSNWFTGRPKRLCCPHGLRDDCWSDGGSDAFDCYGRISLSHGGQQAQLNVTIGQNKQLAVGGYGVIYSSELLGNVWRVTMLPAIENDERRLAVSITGNLGSDGGTQAAIHNYPYQGRQVSTFYDRWRTERSTCDPSVAPDPNVPAGQLRGRTRQRHDHGQQHDPTHDLCVALAMPTALMWLQHCSPISRSKRWGRRMRRDLDTELQVTEE